MIVLINILNASKLLNSVQNENINFIILHENDKHI